MGVDGPPLGFRYVTIFRNVSPLVENLCCAMQDKVYIMGCGPAGDLLRHQMCPPSFFAEH